MTAPTSRCATAHPDDLTPCVGAQDAVRLVVPEWPDTLGCVHHAARVYASLTAPRVYPGRDDAEAGQSAIDVYYAAFEIRPYPWLAENAQRNGGERS